MTLAISAPDDFAFDPGIVAKTLASNRGFCRR